MKKTIAVMFALTLASAAPAQQRSVAITVDDMPSVAPSTVPGLLISAFRARHVPAAGFVIQKNVETLGDAGVNFLRE